VLTRDTERPTAQEDQMEKERQASLKRKAEINPELRKTRGKHPDYTKLQDPFSDDKDSAQAMHYTNAAELDADPLMLKEARISIEWPQWEKAIAAELQQLDRMGTWQLVDRPDDAIPIANKWVFAKKRDKSGNIIKYKARLVAKGCAQ
jgi:hypothetical protein